MKRSKVVLIIMVIFILICLILNISYNKICLSSDTNINQNDYIFSPPWDYNKYYLYPVTYIDHNKLLKDQKDRTFGAVDLYYFKNKNMPNKYPENRYGDGGIEILAANGGKVFINLYYVKTPENTSDINWPRLNIINNNIDDKDIPFTSFKFNKGNKTYYIDMELGVKDKILKTYYVHLKIDLRFFSNIKNELKEEILYFYNNLEFSNNEDYKEIKTGVEVKEGEKVVVYCPESQFSEATQNPRKEAELVLIKETDDECSVARAVVEKKAVAEMENEVIESSPVIRSVHQSESRRVCGLLEYSGLENRA